MNYDTVATGRTVSVEDGSARAEHSPSRLAGRHVAAAVAVAAALVPAVAAAVVAVVAVAGTDAGVGAAHTPQGAALHLDDAEVVALLLADAAAVFRCAVHATHLGVGKC